MKQNGRLDARSVGTKLCDNHINPLLVDDAHTLGRNAQLHEAVFAFQPESVVMDIRYKPSLGLVMRVRDVIAADRPLACYLAYFGHVDAFLFNCPRTHSPGGAAESRALYQKGSLTSNNFAVPAT